MALHASLSQKAQYKRTMRDQSSGEKLPFLRVLQITRTVEINGARIARKEHLPKMLASCRATLAEIDEQMRILNAITRGDIQPVCKWAR